MNPRLPNPQRPGRLSREERRGGFSLIEIIVAVAVIGITTGLVLVNFHGVTRTERLRSAARKIAGMSDFVRSQATGTKRACFLDIDIDLKRYRFRQEPLLDSFGRPISAEDGHLLSEDEQLEWEEMWQWEDLPRGVYFKTVYISAEHFWDEKQVQMKYFPSGTLQSTVIHLMSPHEDRPDDPDIYSVVVNGLTGKSEVVDYEYRFLEANESDFTDVMGTDAPGGEGR